MHIESNMEFLSMFIKIEASFFDNFSSLFEIYLWVVGETGSNSGLTQQPSGVSAGVFT